MRRTRLNQPILTVWHEYRHEHENAKVAATYPQGMHVDLADGLKAQGFENVRTATLDEPEHGLTDKVLQNTDVLLWWGHKAHGDVPDTIAQKVLQRVWDGMGLIVLHSGHFSKPFTRLMGTGCDLNLISPPATTGTSAASLTSSSPSSRARPSSAPEKMAAKASA